MARTHAPRRTRTTRMDDADDDVVFDLVRRTSPLPSKEEQDLMEGWDRIFEHDTVIDPPAFHNAEAANEGRAGAGIFPRWGITPTEPPRPRPRATSTPPVARPPSSRPPPRLVSSLGRDDLSKRIPLVVPAPALPSWKDATRSVRPGRLAPVLDRTLPPPIFPPRTPAGPIAITVPREIDFEHVRALVWLAGAAVLIVAATVYFLT